MMSWLQVLLLACVASPSAITPMMPSQQIPPSPPASPSAVPPQLPQVPHAPHVHVASQSSVGSESKFTDHLVMCSAHLGKVLLPDQRRVDANEVVMQPARGMSGVMLPCTAGYECTPVNRQDLAQGAACAECLLGKYCPSNTSNPLARADANMCPKGHSCKNPRTIGPCPSGKYCIPGTTQGGLRCPKQVTEGWLSWGQTTYCPAQHASALMLDNICDAGFICRNASSKERCPQGHYCAHGTNATSRCRDGFLGMTTAEQRCPEGSASEPAQPELLIALSIGATALCALLEIVSCVEVVQRRRMPSSRSVQNRLHSSDFETHEHEPGDRTARGILGRVPTLASAATSSASSSASNELVPTSHSATEPDSNPASHGTHSTARQQLSYTGPGRVPILFDTGSMTSAPTDHVSASSIASSQSELTHKRVVPPIRFPSLSSPNASPPTSPPSFSSPPLHSRPIGNLHTGVRAGASRGFRAWRAQKREAGMHTARKRRLGRADTWATPMPEPHGSSRSAEEERFAAALRTIGDAKLRVKGRALIKLELSNLSFHIGRARVLRGLNALMQHGELVALMGESGCGKTTLLNIIGGRAGYGWVSSSTAHPMILNGRPYQPTSIRSLIGYVPQAHLLFKELTVYENLLFAARLRLPRHVPEAHCRQLVEMALDLLGLHQCRHFVCDPSIGERLSGGQMRRVGIGIELVCDPPIMLLDEPTSALDAVNTRLVMAALKDLCKRGVLVVASLHQPRHAVYEMLDRLLLLRKGELIFGGMRQDALHYFDMLGYHLPVQVNPADFFIEVAFGFEVSNSRTGDGHLPRGVKHNELPCCFGLHRYFLACQKASISADIDAEQEVSVTTLAFLWDRWLSTAKNSCQRVMNILTAQQSEERRRALAVLEFAKRHLARRRGKIRRSADSRLALLKGICRPTPSTGASCRSHPVGTSGSIQIGRSNVDALVSPRLPSPFRGHSRRRASNSLASAMNDYEPVTPDAKKRTAACKLDMVPWSASQVDRALLDVEEVEVGLTAAAGSMQGNASITLSETDQGARCVNDRLSDASMALPEPASPLTWVETEVVQAVEVPDCEQISFTPPALNRGGSPDMTVISRADRTFSHTASARLVRNRLPLQTLSPGSCQASVSRCDTASGHNCTPPQKSFRASAIRLFASEECTRRAFMGVSRAEFREWCRSADGFSGAMKDELADVVWLKASDAAEQAVLGQRWQLPRAMGIGAGTPRDLQDCDRHLPMWCQLREVMDNWSMPRGDQPLWATHLSVCIQRYALKYIRTRTRTYLLLLLTSMLGSLCGILHGQDPDRNDCLIFYMLFNTMFGSICATALVGAFGGGRETADFLRHEAYSGVSQTAEGLARLLVDVILIALLAPFFALSLLAFGTLRAAIVIPWMAFAWAMSPLGYIFTLMAPGNANVLTTCTTFVICAFANGFFGIKLSALPSSMWWLVKLSPGFSALRLVALGSALEEPFATKRWALLRQLRGALMVPQGKGELLQYELGLVDWVDIELQSLLYVGLALRVVAVILFYCRSNFELVGRTEHFRLATLKRVSRLCTALWPRLYDNDDGNPETAARNARRSRLFRSDRRYLQMPRSADNKERPTPRLVASLWSQMCDRDCRNRAPLTSHPKGCSSVSFSVTEMTCQTSEATPCFAQSPLCSDTSPLSDDTSSSQSTAPRSLIRRALGSLPNAARPPGSEEASVAAPLTASCNRLHARTASARVPMPLRQASSNSARNAQTHARLNMYSGASSLMCVNSRHPGFTSTRL